MLERQQIGSLTSLICPVRPCCAETHGSHKTHESHSAILYKTVKGENRPDCIRISTSQIFVIFYGIMTRDIASLVVIAAL